MHLEYQTSYLEHNCRIYDNLVVIKYYEYAKTLPDFEKFNSMAIFDALDKAKKLLLKEHPNAQIVLEIPDLVAKI